jgi:hypothetical protein
MNGRRHMSHAGSLFVFCIAVVGLFAACSWREGKARPEWIDGTSAEFPTSRYLVGVGQSERRTGAEEQAYAALSKIFKAEIVAQSKDWETYLVVENRSHARTERRLTLDSIIRVSTDKVLENVRILDVWFDRKKGQYYALSGMDKTQAESVLLDRISELDHSIETHMTEARQAHDKLSRVRNLKRAAKNLVVRDAYNTDLRVVRASGQGHSSSYRIVDVMNELEEFLATNLAIAVELSGDQVDAVRRALMEGLTREGFSVAGPTSTGGLVRPETQRAELMVTGTVRLWPLDVRDPQFTYVRWCSDAVIEDVSTQRIVGAVSKGGREGHLTDQEATAKAVRVMQHEFSSDMARAIAGYVYGDSEPPAAIGIPSGCPRDERIPKP